MVTVKELIKKQGISFRALSEETGIDRRALKKRVEEPGLFSLEEIGRLAKALHCNDKFLFECIVKEAKP